jgi:hypothetical protein
MDDLFLGAVIPDDASCRTRTRVHVTAAGHDLVPGGATDRRIRRVCGAGSRPGTTGISG